ncbi:DUF952 domain-containing protein [Mycobacterium sp. TNTM28]|uniref:DUF952 domain-containing protein n=1 Tax=[Mycobacterium] fortunisiensis TaxID=2600579 RepID=A0ABS6KM94_9MYCO|nr:DUF952 domain-containing protein [[Mycobacterium] fortunisiensis]MBU9764687.1 DUF952 domain-containing protein [[Mycobacterium] fortunisiensis]
MPRVLVHICSVDDWSEAQRSGELRPESLAGQGFVHLSAPEQVHLPANRLYSGRRDLMLLHVDPAKLSDPVRWEPGVPTDPEAMLFPHLYGPLPVSAVRAATRYEPDEAGRFAPLPSGAPPS